MLQGLKEYRESQSEEKRSEDLARLVRLIPGKRGSVLDVGARDGHFSLALTEFYERVTALDLEKPSISHEGIDCVEGNITKLAFAENAFELVFCAEVLEHLSPTQLQTACSELSRVTKEFLIIGVPYKQDIRVGRTTCYSCGKPNPPWGHVSSFDRNQLVDLFPGFSVYEMSFVGESCNHTNSLSKYLLDLAGNPYGTYIQHEPCIYCGEKLKIPPERTFLQKVCAKAAYSITGVQKLFFRVQPNWIHILFQKIP